MSNIWKVVLLVALFASATGCDTGPHAATGFRLPSYGNIERGQTAFVEHGCTGCHRVAGLDLPGSGQMTPVQLGGAVSRPVTDGWLVTSIINPAHRVRPHEGTPAMPDFAERMTVRDLTDIVAFLHSKYTVPSPRPNAVVY